MGVKTTAVFLYLCILNPPPPQMFAMNIRIEWQIVGCVHIPKSASHQPSFTLKPCKDNNCISVFWHTPPPKCLARISGWNEKCWVVHISQKWFSYPPSFTLKPKTAVVFLYLQYNTIQRSRIQYNIYESETWNGMSIQMLHDNCII